MATGNITRLEGVWPETHERAVRDSAGVNLETKLGNINSNISQLDQEVNGVDVTQATNAGTGSSLWKNNGSDVITYGSSSMGLHRANVIAIEAGQTIDLATTLGSTSANAAFIADASDNILQTIAKNGSSTSATVIAPTNAARLYVNYLSTYSVHLSGYAKRVEDLEDLTEALVGKEAEDARNIAVMGDALPPAPGPQQSLQLAADMFENGNIDSTTGEATTSLTSIRTKGYLRIISGTKLTYHTINSYRVGFAFYTWDKQFISKNEWYSGDGNITAPYGAEKIRLIIGSPSGSSDRATFAASGLTISANPGLTYSEAAPRVANAELPIYAPNPQLPANADQSSDFNAETLTPAELFGAFGDFITALPKPGQRLDLPKFAGVCSKVGRDASDTFNIYAYQFGKRNRYAWKAADGLFAWASGSTVVYTDSISPLVGDTIYSDAARTDSGATVSAFNAADQQITSSASDVYTRSKDDDVAIDVLWTTSAQTVTTPTNKTLYTRDGTSAGTGTAVDLTHFTLDSKTYARCEELDYHTNQKMTIVLWGNEHGPQSDPAEPAITLYRMAKDLCGGCRDNKFLAFLKNYCKVIMIPCANPYGLENHSRNNANNVNINRNYSTPGWSSQNDADKGSYAGDQPETQFIMNTVMYFGADLAIDIHCLGYNVESNEGLTHWDGDIPNAAANSKLREVMNSLSMEWSKYGDATPETRATGGDWLYYHKISGGLIEMNAGAYSSISGGNGKQHTPFIMEVDYTLLLQTIRLWMYGVDASLDLSRYMVN